jgi:hypothetical protein
MNEAELHVQKTVEMEEALLELVLIWSRAKKKTERENELSCSFNHGEDAKVRAMEADIHKGAAAITYRRGRKLDRRSREHPELPDAKTYAEAKANLAAWREWMDDELIMAGMSWKYNGPGTSEPEDAYDWEEFFHRLRIYNWYYFEAKRLAELEGIPHD